ncbi:hypothetical protein FRC17_001851, partial [Serendipita sp. 399]
MANFDQMYNSNYFEGTHNAYTMHPIPPNAQFDPHVADVSSAFYPQSDSWNLVDQSCDPFLFSEMYLDQPPCFSNETEWLHHPSSLTDPYASQLSDPTMAYNNAYPRDVDASYLRCYEQSQYPLGNDNNNHSLHASAPVAIQSTGQGSPLPAPSWASIGSRLSVTPPNDSGSDGGSDDHHHMTVYRTTESPSGSSSGSSWLAPSPREETTAAPAPVTASVETNVLASPTIQPSPPRAPATSPYYRVRNPQPAASGKAHLTTPVSPTPVRIRQAVPPATSPAPFLRTAASAINAYARILLAASSNVKEPDSTLETWLWRSIGSNGCYLLVDPDAVPPSIKAEKPKGSGFCCVRFMPAGDFGWPLAKDVAALTQKQIEATLEKDKKKSGKLYQGYVIAKDPQAWIAEQELQRLAQIEIEANAEEDQLDGDDDATEKKSKKRRGPAETKTTGRRKKEEDSKKKRPVKKRKVDEEEDFDSKPSKKKAKKEEEEDSTLHNDPEAVKIKDWRHQLQRAFLRDNVKPEATALPEYDEVFNTIEAYQGMNVQYLSYSKIGKVMKKISQLEDAHIPDNDGQFKFRERAGKLVTQWH